MGAGMALNIAISAEVAEHRTDGGSVERHHPEREREELVPPVGHPPEIEVLEDESPSRKDHVMHGKGLALALVHRWRIDAEQPDAATEQEPGGLLRERRPGVRE